MVCLKYISVGIDHEAFGSWALWEGGSDVPKDVQHLKVHPRISVEGGVGQCESPIDWFFGYSYASTTVTSLVIPDSTGERDTHTLSLGTGHFSPRRIVGDRRWNYGHGIQDDASIDIDFVSGDVSAIDVGARVRRGLTLYGGLGPAGLRLALTYSIKSLMHSDDSIAAGGRGTRPALIIDIGLKLSIGQNAYIFPNDGPLTWEEGASHSMSGIVGHVVALRTNKYLAGGRDVSPTAQAVLAITAGALQGGPMWSHHEALYRMEDGTPTAANYLGVAGEAVFLAVDIGQGVASDNEITRSQHLSLLTQDVNMLIDGSVRLLAPKFYNEYGVMLRTMISCSELLTSFAFENEDVRQSLQFAGGQCVNEVLLRPLGKVIGMIRKEEKTLW